ncbi:hypothetical protein SALBM217S_08587 [Streptomyces griseoloalbus]
MHRELLTVGPGNLSESTGDLGGNQSLALNVL